MQECRDIFGKIEISAGMWNTYKKTHFKLPTKSQNPQINIFRAKIRCLNKKITGFAFLGSVGHFFVFFFFLVLKKKM